MTNKQFNTIEKRAWRLYENSTTYWILENIKNLSNSPKWFKKIVDNSYPIASIKGYHKISTYDIEHIKKSKGILTHILTSLQLRNFPVNFSEEVLKYHKAVRDSNEFNIIDSLCNMIIILGKSGRRFCQNYYETNIEKSKFFILDDLDIFHHTTISDISLIIKNKGFEPYLCLLENLKKIESLKDYWDGETCKWNTYSIIDLFDDKKRKSKKLYKPDYFNCISV